MDDPESLEEQWENAEEIEMDDADGQDFLEEAWDCIYND